MIRLVVLFFAFSTLQAAKPPILNCTRYLEPCESRQGDCCGYPFYDCLSDGRNHLCQSIKDFPELNAEVLLRLRAAKDRGDPAVEKINGEVYDLLAPSKNGKKNGKSPGKEGGKDSKERGKSPGKEDGKDSKKKGESPGKEGGKDGKETGKSPGKEDGKDSKKKGESPGKEGGKDSKKKD